MWKVAIDGIPGLDGEYPLSFEFTNRHWRTIKRLSGVRPNELNDALEADDNDVLVAIVAVALEQNGKRYTDDMLWDAKPGAAVLVGEEVEDDARPPEPGQETDGSKRSSGQPSNGNGDLSPEMSTQPVIGTPV